MTSHGHSHTHLPGDHSSRAMSLVLLITVAVVVAQWVGVLITASLALAADAGHQLTDAIGITIALVAARIASRSPSPTRTFGYLRAEVLSAVVHATLIAAMCVILIREAWTRWNSPTVVTGPGVMAFAFVGLVANLSGLLILRSVSQTNLNVRTAFLDVASDALTSAVVLFSGALTALTGIHRLDIIATAIVVVAIVARTWGVISEAIHILMEGAPAHINPADVRTTILSLPGIIAVHDLHVWAINPDSPMISAHVVIEQTLHDSGGSGRVLDELESLLGSTFDVRHTTLQIEHPGHLLHEHPHHE